MNNSSMNEYNGSEITISEESGWTDYLVDFSEIQKGNMSSISCSSLISDAANNNNNNNYNCNNPVLKRLNFNKKNNCKKYSYDEDLEDTASSPVNSPKVSGMKQMEVKYRKNGVTFGDVMGKEEAGSSYFSGLSRDEVKNGNNMNMIDSSTIVDLKKRGLCLMPISAFINYIQ
ncbi:hypothetical protein ACJIZ3_010846 [Penstemon smallii]|uniref:Uncharacterized protein n=1 Tax=Penstemon smallii TaxID=265156 RepID=A0ABD3UHH7_9LAMI